MNPKSLAILAAVTVLVVAAAFLALGDDEGASAGASPSGAEGAELLPGLSAKVNDVATVTIAKAGQTTTLNRDGRTWTCADAAGYPADAEKVRSLLVALARMEVLSAMTSNPERHSELGLGDEAGARVTLKTADGSAVADVVLGDTKYARSGQQIYARRADANETYLCRADLTPSADPTTWVDKQVIRIDSQRPRSIEVTHADGERVSASRGTPAQTNWDVEDVPDDRGLKSEGIANSMGTVLSYLSFDEVKKASELELGTHHAATARYATFDGLTVDVRVAKIDGASWITLSASGEAPETVGPEAPEAPEEAEDAGAADEPDPAAEAAELNARFDGWAYKIPEFKADLMLRRMSDLLNAEDGATPLDTGEDPGMPGEGMRLEDLDPELRKAIEDMQKGLPPPDEDGIEPVEEPGIEPDPAPDAPADDSPEDGSDGARD